MTAKELLALPVSGLAKRDAMLVLWSTWMHLALAMKVIDAWGFTYCAGFPWLKVVNHSTERVFTAGNWMIPAPIFGPGVWAQGCTELVLLARRGQPFGSLGNPRPARKGIIIASRGAHSEKPVELQDWIDAKFPDPKIELFARRHRPGWTCWGDQL